MVTILSYISIIFLCMFGENLFFNRSKGVSIRDWDIVDTRTLKGAAILIIILSHIGGANGTRYFTPLGGIGVSVFLLLSGYGLCHSTSNRYFWTKRFLTLYPCYFIACLFYNYFRTNDFSYTAFLSDIFIINSTLPLVWYIKYQILCYLFFWIAYRLEKYLLVEHTIALFSISSFVFLPEIMAEQSLSFFSGVIIAKHTNIKTLFQNKCFIFLMFALGVFSLSIKQIHFIRQMHPVIISFIQLFIKLPLAFSFIYIVRYIEKRFQCILLTYCGLFSYQIYLVHGIIMEFITVNSITSLLMFIISTLVISVGLYYVSKYIKMNIELRNINI